MDFLFITFFHIHLRAKGKFEYLCAKLCMFAGIFSNNINNYINHESIEKKKQGKAKRF